MGLFMVLGCVRVSQDLRREARPAESSSLPRFSRQPHCLQHDDK